MLKKFHPPHIYFDQTIYFLTARIYNGQAVLNTPEKKQILTHNIAKNFNLHRYKIFAWVILDNHYHLLLKTFIGRDLSEIMNRIHGQTSFILNKLDNQAGRKIFQNYFDRCARDEKEFWLYFNYIHHNPVKHGYYREQEDVVNYQFSSYRQWLDKKGTEWANSIFTGYPIIDFTLE